MKYWPRKVLVTGSRFWDSKFPIYADLTGLYYYHAAGWLDAHTEAFHVVEGGQKKLVAGTENEYTGADHIAGQWCKDCPTDEFDTCWTRGLTMTQKRWNSIQGMPPPLKNTQVVKDMLKQCPVVHHCHPADWGKYGKAAGPIRNSYMLTQHPDVDLVLAYHSDLANSRGTKDMIDKAKRAGIEVWHRECLLPPRTLFDG